MVLCLMDLSLLFLPEHHVDQLCLEVQDYLEHLAAQTFLFRRKALGVL